MLVYQRQILTTILINHSFGANEAMENYKVNKQYPIGLILALLSAVCLALPAQSKSEQPTGSFSLVAAENNALLAETLNNKVRPEWHSLKRKKMKQKLVQERLGR